MKTNTIISKDGKVYSLIADYDFDDDICTEIEKEFTEHLLNMGYSKGAKDMEKAKQIIIDSLLKEIEQIRADVIEDCISIVDGYLVDMPITHDNTIKALCKLKEQK